MAAAKQDILHLLKYRKDREALALIENDPALVDAEIVTAALDNGCVRVIRYLRKKDLITAEGKAEREELRISEANAKIEAFDKEIADIEKLLDL